MYGGDPIVTALPATGIGTMAVVAGTGQGQLLVFAITVLASWTLIAAARAVMRMVPMAEV